jgi:hypothetical protein
MKLLVEVTSLFVSSPTTDSNYEFLHDTILVHNNVKDADPAAV